MKTLRNPVVRIANRTSVQVDKPLRAAGIFKMKEIKLTQGKSVLVSDDDFEYLNKWKWHVSKHCNKLYARRTVVTPIGKRGIFMHRQILDLSKGEFCDHKDRNTLNNQRENLRKCTWAENQRNKTKKLLASSKYIGVIKTKFNSFVAQMTHEWKHIYIGTYKDEVIAAKAYDKKKLELHGKFSNLNSL